MKIRKLTVSNNSILSSYDFSTDGFSFADIQTQSLPRKNSSSGTPAATNSPASSSSGTARNTQDWCKKLAYRYRRIQEIYSKYGCDLESKLYIYLMVVNTNNIYTIQYTPLNRVTSYRVCIDPINRRYKPNRNSVPKSSEILNKLSVLEI